MKLTREEIKTLIACFEECQYMADSNYSSDLDDDEKALLKRANEALNIDSVVLPTDKEGTLVCDECNQEVKMITYTEVFPSCGCDEGN